MNVGEYLKIVGAVVTILAAGFGLYQGFFRFFRGREGATFLRIFVTPQIVKAEPSASLVELQVKLENKGDTMMLDSIVTPAFEGNDVVLAAWHAAKKVHAAAGVGGAVPMEEPQPTQVNQVTKPAAA